MSAAHSCWPDCRAQPYSPQVDEYCLLAIYAPLHNGILDVLSTYEPHRACERGPLGVFYHVILDKHGTTLRKMDQIPPFDKFLDNNHLWNEDMILSPSFNQLTETEARGARSQMQKRVANIGLYGSSSLN